MDTQAIQHTASPLPANQTSNPENGALDQYNDPSNRTVDDGLASTTTDSDTSPRARSDGEPTETELTKQQDRIERQDEVEFRNTDGDTATLTRRGREASQITANQPV
ncbi:MAG: hypothetical protein ACQETE_14385 [Bacteroidota bacterium]